jgi:chemotaxis protein MotB
MRVENLLVMGTMALSAMMMSGCSSWSGVPISADGGYEYRNRNMIAKPGVGDDRASRMAALEQERQKLSETLAGRDQELVALRGNVSDASQEIARLKGQLGQGQVGADELARTKDQVASMTGTLSKRDQEIVLLRASLDQQKGSLAKAERDLFTSLQPEIAKGHVTVQQFGDQLTINLSSGALFDSGQDTVKAAGVDILKRIGAVLKGFPEKQVQVDGHTDNVAIQGALLKKFPNNQALSKSRAVNAMQILGQGGVASVKLDSTGYADTKPVASNESEAGRHKNRRVEIVVSQLRVDSLTSF